MHARALPVSRDLRCPYLFIGAKSDSWTFAVNRSSHDVHSDTVPSKVGSSNLGNLSRALSL